MLGVPLLVETQLIDGKAFAAKLLVEIGAEVSALRGSHHLTPGLAVVLVGEDPASQVYVAQQGQTNRRGGHALF